MGDDVRLYCGDCLDLLPDLPDGAVDAVVTDPPYGVNLQYDGGFEDTADTWERLVPPVVSWADEREIPCVVFGSSPTQGRDLALFPRWPDRTLIWAPAFSLSKSRSGGVFFRWHPVYCWNLPKRHGGPSVDVLRQSCDGRNWWDHPGTKPVALMEVLVCIAPEGATVLDPFAGSGTTGVACVHMGRRFVGIEISSDYYEIAERRIAEARMQLPLPMGEASS